MANGLAIETGNDATVATDDVAGQHYQILKLASGAEDATTRILIPVAAADNLANPTVVEVLSYLMAFDGTTWDRVRTDGTAGAIRTAFGPQFAGQDALSNTSVLVRSDAGTTLAPTFYPMAFNGTDWDRARGNLNKQLLASAARTATTNSPDQVSHNARGVALLLDVIANPGGIETLTVSIEAKLGGKYRAITAFAATASGANDTYVYILYPGIVETAATANVEVQGLVLPRDWRAKVTHSAAGSWTYSLESSLIL